MPRGIPKRDGSGRGIRANRGRGRWVLFRYGVEGKVRCPECGRINPVTKAYYTAKRLKTRYLRWNGRYLLKCECGYWAELPQKEIDYAKQHNGYLPPLESLNLSKSLGLREGAIKNTK